ncbi:membrane-bound lytic murein transglycosylase A [Vibrio nigripulchritudo SFn27]|uniref:peptidoglycan lytic exotransglycosylase n=1 Tax=Vibrio nigripulchritudo TaxID=28173 RepID=U4KD63_9VIBR|nr:murein transglycosylase A [Vibrio nigripulchritudo]CCN83108.1 membrane-bound lytic murein transglycosylase A [Vibrio nigripulchritudo BLFn1]CCN86288.1 membrane-bound lytic murein transglycosylase A [Vibrio nigripulchritudo SFn27]CCN92848.1 membrane-bound lytic murein transglycosylase A [Vibrio nigripulchritudo ENn2]CCO42716.1 membrane-bound lytic murein transglycosylase A [Vibrio nigripulchritudo SFn135]CCO52582.1 membrane-bound lytic murein transglycosylase A [Vibrio nigripulchritudo Wn13]
MFKKFLCFGAVATLVGCAAPTERGQQYLDGEFSSALNQTEQIESNKPRNYLAFNAQAEQVLVKSPSMSRTFQPLYEQLSAWTLNSGDPKELANYGIQAAQLAGGDDKGNVLFTGYFSPVIELRHQPNDTFKYPVYKMPTCEEQCPTRAEINSGALEGMGLELGYAANMIDPFIMEVQGSGFVHFEDDDTLEYFAYGGKNGHPYVSIGKVLIERNQVPREKMSLKAIKEWVLAQEEEVVRELLEQNTSYVFFEPRQAAPVTGTAGIPLLPMASVAGDRRLFPMGTPILAEVPLLNADGTFSGAHELRLLIVLDTGGAVKQNHLDLYHGMGPRAGTQAGHYKHFGRVWKLGLEASATQSPWALPPEKRD